jgi:hypothetical protein
MENINEVVGIYLTLIDLAPVKPDTIFAEITLLQFSKQLSFESNNYFGK